MISKAIKELLTGIIDYAGLFPPAELSLQETLNNFINYQHSKHKWMLGKIIIPENLLAETSIYLATKINKPLPVSLLTQKPLEFFNSDTYSKYKPLLNISCIETKLPANSHLEFIQEIGSKLQKSSLQIFLELSYQDNWEELLPDVISTIKKQGISNLGFKLRCGAVTSEETPSVSKLALAIELTSRAKVPIKFTAGLHHPVRKFHTGFNGYMHGFLNVYITSLLSYKYSLNNENICKLLESEEICNLITDDLISINDYKLSSVEVGSYRQNLVLSFGSCSFEEPIEDLANLNLL